LSADTSLTGVWERERRSLSLLNLGVSCVFGVFRIDGSEV